MSKLMQQYGDLTSGLRTQDSRLSRSLSRPPRCSIANVTTGESIECLFNPTQLTEKVKINWNRLAVPGLSHQVLQYQSTGNRQVAGVEFYVDKFFAAKQPGNPDILRFRAFLRALSVPPAEMLAPSRALIIWPKVLTVETVLTELEFQYQQFGVDASVLVHTAVCGFEEILDVRRSPES